MWQYRKYLLSLIFSLTVLICSAAADVNFSVNAPQVVATGEVFRVEFSLDAKPDGKPSFGSSFDGFDILAGPSESSGRSVSIINGNMTQSVNYTYTYVLTGNQIGIFTIPTAEVKVDGKIYKTQPYKIEVVAENSSQSATTPSTSGQQNISNDSSSIASDDILLRITVDKTEVYKGQPVRASIKLYTRSGLSGVESAKYPSFNGFWTQELDASQYQWQRESYNNKVYDSRILREYLLFPQQSGTLTIEAMELTAIAQVVVQSHRQSIFDDFFGGNDIQEVRRHITSQPVKIKVKDLPATAPDSFTGAVGEFEMSATVPEGDVKANSAITYSIKISGNGNLPLIQAPKIELPSSFEQYNVKTTESLQNDQRGISGYRQFDYPIIARAEGEFDIPETKFTYFSPSRAQYVTLTAEAAHLTVQPDNNSGNNASRGLVSGIDKEDIKFLGKDIRFIKIDSPALKENNVPFIANGFYYLIILALIGGSVVAYTQLRKAIANRSNTAFVKGRMANKVALQRFKAAEEHMKSDNQRGFYEEMLKALWGYMGDKLNIPVANLTKENVREGLLKRHISPEMAERYIKAISDCEYAQYAPDSTGRMQEAYVDGVEIVSILESEINR